MRAGELRTDAPNSGGACQFAIGATDRGRAKPARDQERHWRMVLKNRHSFTRTAEQQQPNASEFALKVTLPVTKARGSICVGVSMISRL